MTLSKIPKHIRLTSAGIIWPGPVNGPHPFTLFKVITPLFILWIGVLPASILMGFLASVLSLYFYETIMREGSYGAVDDWIDKLPNTFRKALRLGTISSLIPLALFTGPFPLALSFRYIKLTGFRARFFLIAGSFANSLIWTGVIWGGGLNILRAFIDNVSFL